MLPGSAFRITLRFWLAFITGLLGLVTHLTLAAQADRLAGQSSPYLRHHANDPIPWYPWGREALERAVQEDKPIFLSIGYSACHWCAVMARETFANPEVGAELGDHFVAILVDREERPDLDGYWLQVAESMTGKAGWPQNLLLTPDLLPLFAGNYFPPHAQAGQSGLLDILQGLAKVWQSDRGRLLAKKDEIRHQINELLVQPSSTSTKQDSPDGLIERAQTYWLARADHEHGGFMEEPKFPHASVLSLLLREGVRHNRGDTIQQVKNTLDRMAAGALRDPLSGLFFRYSVDRAWGTPHYEIMLADNVLLARVYLEGYLATHEARYAWVARGILDALMERFLLAGGGMATSLAAESPDQEGRLVEGFYYRWTPGSLGRLLPDADDFLQKFGLGNHKEGGALRLLAAPETIQEVYGHYQRALQRLAHRQRHRLPPNRDDKVITAWNSLAAGVFSQAARVLDEPRYQQTAQNLVSPIVEQFRREGRIVHIRVADTWGTEEFLDDYAFLTLALVTLYETDFQHSVLQTAWDVSQTMLTRFHDRPDGLLLRLTPQSDNSGLPGQVGITDRQGLPSGNAAAWTALARLNLWRQDPGLTSRLARLFAHLPEVLGDEAHEAGELLGMFAFRPEVASEIVIAGSRGDEQVRSLLSTIRSRWVVGEMVAWVMDPDHSEAEAQLAAWGGLANRKRIDEKTTLYRCLQGVCLPPVTDPVAMEKMLRLALPANQLH